MKPPTTTQTRVLMKLKNRAETKEYIRESHKPEHVHINRIETKHGAYKWSLDLSRLFSLDSASDLLRCREKLIVTDYPDGETEVRVPNKEMARIHPELAHIYNSLSD